MIFDRYELITDTHDFVVITRVGCDWSCKVTLKGKKPVFRYFSVHSKAADKGLLRAVGRLRSEFGVTGVYLPQTATKEA